ncbi:DUF84 family protein [Paucibacter sp. O1-1]|nr:DUF84 family protein [Paucibacter sp. O1-1]MDA3831035.1 DUF84 family protein [Paucibacter sp. O1-1]
MLAKNAIAQYYPNSTVRCQGMHAPSKVAEQPMTEAETKLGAINALNIVNNKTQTADFYVAMEGGVDHFDNIQQRLLIWRLSVMALYLLVAAPTYPYRRPYIML